MARITGECLCGNIRYLMASDPVRTTVCYCKFCQRATGAAQMILAVFPRTDLSFVRGKPGVYVHISEGSGKEMCVHFCKECGTKLYLNFERWPDIVGLYSGTLDDPAVVKLDAANSKQIFVSSARPGTVLLAGIPAFLEHATTLTGENEKAFVLPVPTAIEDLKSV